MREASDFFRQQADQCRGALAERAGNKSGREFWLQLTRRWERLLQAGGGNIEADEERPSFERPLFRKKSALAKRFAKTARRLGLSAARNAARAEDV